LFVNFSPGDVHDASGQTKANKSSFYHVSSFLEQGCPVPRLKVKCPESKRLCRKENMERRPS
jgi:hypothetical protein